MAGMDKATMRKLLREVKGVAEHASMTGSLRGGVPVLVEVYNRCLKALVEQGDTLVGELLPTLSPNTESVDVVGAAAALLAAYIAPDGGGHRHPGPVFPPDVFFGGEGGGELPE